MAYQPRDLPLTGGAGSIVVVFFAFPGFAALVDGQGSDACCDGGLRPWGGGPGAGGGVGLNDGRCCWLPLKLTQGG